MNNWVKIGEVVKDSFLLRRGFYSRYAVMELICKSGMRKYKEVLICTWTQSAEIKTQE